LNIFIYYISYYNYTLQRKFKTNEIETHTVGRHLHGMAGRANAVLIYKDFFTVFRNICSTHLNICSHTIEKIEMSITFQSAQYYTNRILCYFLRV